MSGSFSPLRRWDLWYNVRIAARRIRPVFDLPNEEAIGKDAGDYQKSKKLWYNAMIKMAPGRGA